MTFPSLVTETFDEPKYSGMLFYKACKGKNSQCQDLEQVAETSPLEQVAQGGCGCPIPGGIPGQAGCGSGQPGLVVGDPAHSRSVETR